MGNFYMGLVEKLGPFLFLKKSENNFKKRLTIKTKKTIIAFTAKHGKKDFN